MVLNNCAKFGASFTKCTIVQLNAPKFPPKNSGFELQNCISTRVFKLQQKQRQF